ncbi:hypothetical protein [Streptomyces sp. NBC_01497]|uniref:hypothetical protein n=1 Tax=Streptomyces sp. NBC_01497 TaxID=2903885 RepID=UPI002E34495B|nr:hypothetical protein [Streptomyces sp. NBC_01497]
MKEESLILLDIDEEDLSNVPTGARSWIKARKETVGLVLQEIEPYRGEPSSTPMKIQEYSALSESEKEDVEILARMQQIRWRIVRSERPFSIQLTTPGHSLVCRVEPVDGSHCIYAADGTCWRARSDTADASSRGPEGPDGNLNCRTMVSPMRQPRVIS